MSSPQLIVKVLLLLAHAVCSYNGMTPPTPAPRPADEKPNRVIIPDFLNHVPGLHKSLIMSAKVSPLACSYPSPNLNSHSRRSFSAQPRSQKPSPCSPRTSPPPLTSPLLSPSSFPQHAPT